MSQEVRARDARVIAVATEGDTNIQRHADDVLYVPAAPEPFAPLLAIIPHADAGLPRRRAPWLRHRPATQPCQVGDRRVAVEVPARVLCVAVWQQ